MTLGFTQCRLFYCLYIGVVNDIPVLIAIFVDDILVASSTVETIKHIVMLFRKKYIIKDMGVVDEFLNIRISQKDRPGVITMSQGHYVRNLLQKHSKFVGGRNYGNTPAEAK